MSQQKMDSRLARRDFLRWLCKITGGVSAITFTPQLLPLKRMNTTLFSSEAHAQDCTDDVCTIRDACEIGDAGHTCHQQDVCEIDESGDCTGDRCVHDASGDCTNDGGPSCPEDETCPEDVCSDDFGGFCTSDSSGSCTNDGCIGDASGPCQTDLCKIDSSDECTNDTCVSDASFVCQTDACVSDKSGECTNDECVLDKSGDCETDTCVSDSSGACWTDTCRADASGGCTNDQCVSDSSGGCETDTCASDISGECTNDECVADSSGGCQTDTCVSDKSGGCETDVCVSDSSGACTNDQCTADSSGGCTARDRCNSDYSGVCSLLDVCVLDVSSDCASDLCREDRTPIGSECTTSDTCALDLALNALTSRRQFARAGINKAIKLLYKFAAVVLFIGLAYGQSEAETVINAANAVFSHTPTYVTAGAVSVPSPVGPFLRDCDNDGILEADVNGDGQCTGDPEVRDYNGDGSRELPEGTPFTGDFQFTCFYIPDDVAIVATGPLSIAASREAAVFGAVRIASGVQISSLAMIDLRTSAWLCEDGSEIRFTTSLTGEIDETQTAYAEDDSVPPITFTSLCADIRKVVKAVPTLTWWGMIAFGLAAMGSAVGVLLRKRRHGTSGM